jgi:hypothetical protein
MRRLGVSLVSNKVCYKNFLLSFTLRDERKGRTSFGGRYDIKKKLLLSFGQNAVKLFSNSYSFWYLIYLFIGHNY